MISGTKGDGEVRVLNSHEWYEVVYARGIPSASFVFFPLLSFYCKGALRRPARKERYDRVRADGGRTMHTMGVLLED